jgi:hypothetical protein
MRLVPRMVCSCFLLFGVAVACGDRSGLPLAPVDCKEKALEVTAVPNLYFVLDRSRSMNSPPDGATGESKWDIVRNDVADLMTTVGERAQFGTAVFPIPLAMPSEQQQCEAGIEVMGLRLGDGLSGTTPGSTAASFLAATSMAPLGGTPTAATFLKLKDKLAALRGPTFAILATDGGPNCNGSLTCSVDTCTANIDRLPTCVPEGPNCCLQEVFDCLDGARTVAATAELAAAGVRTFVIGVPGSEAYASVLNEVAKAGGTARAKAPYYYPVGSNSASLIEALTSIAARITGCTLELKKPPSDPGDINVVIKNVQVPQEGPDGWTLNGNIVTLEGKTCDDVLASGSKVLVTLGCPTIFTPPP